MRVTSISSIRALSAGFRQLHSDFVHRLRQIRSVIRLKPFDTATPEGMSRERYRRIALTTITSIAAKGIAVLTTLVSIPLTVHYLGSERFGLWMTISSLMMMMAFADLGLSSGLLNVIAEAHGKDDRTMASRFTSTGWFVLVMVATALGILFVAIVPWINWSRLYNLAGEGNRPEAVASTAVVAGVFLLNIPLGVVERVRLGYQEGFINAVFAALGGLLGLGLVLLVIRFRGSLPLVVLALAAPPLLAGGLNGVLLFARQRPWLRPRWATMDWQAARLLLQRGSLFFVLNLAVALAFTSDNLIVAHVLDLQTVTDFSVAARLFGVIPMLLGFVLTPLWPAYGEAMAKGDTDWVQRTLLRSMAVSLLVAAALAAVLVCWGPAIVRVWVGPEVRVPFSLLAGLGIWVVIMSGGNVVAMWLNAASIVRFQVVVASLMALAAVGLKILLTRWWGISGVAWGAVFAYTFCVVIPYAVFVPRLFQARLRELRKPMK